MDYGKFVFEQNRRLSLHGVSKSRSRSRRVTLPGTEEGDYQVSCNLIKFLTHGDKDKVTLRFTGWRRRTNSSAPSC